VAQVGRISGPLLFANLERNGIDLAFRNTLSDTQLLYLNVNNGIIGVNKANPGNQLDISGTTKTTNLIAETNAQIADFDISTGQIQNLSGDINLNAASSINLSNFQTDNVKITDNTISTYRSNANIELKTNGTGTIESLSSVNVYGDIHSTGDITMDGNIVIGDAADDSTYPTDTITLNADIASDMLPDINVTYDIGLPNKRFILLEAQSINGNITISGGIDAAGAVLTERAGNIFYVAENGDDTNVGDHPNGPFKTLKHALSVADASIGGPVTIYVYPGGYEEELPLVIPTNTSIIGLDMRNTFIRPESAYQSEDVFHLNGETTIQNLTVTDFYYDSVGDTGYAFRFAPNAVITSRSPYVQNVTVITKGTTTSASDPRGFASGDAGKGALVDGGVVPSASEEASMLFHSCTFITPGVDAITMTNGVRVEWLNSFTYFANRGLYAKNGVTGHLSTDGSTVKYGAEIRSIGSANVYGNYGAVADGADCLMYLIQHNFAYIGVGKYVDNDPSRVIQSQEATELNSGKIYYQSIDHLGNFRVGDDFTINQETGETTLNLTEADIDSLNGLTITTNNQTTYIDGERVQTGNIRLSGNTISSLAGAINISAASGNINYLDDTSISKNLDVSGNLSVGGALITLGDQPTDTINFETEFTQNIVPDISGLYNLGSSSKTWKNIWLSQAQISDIKIQDNFITTSASNADLELRANSTGKIYIPNNNVNFLNALTVNGDTSLKNTTITGTFTPIGDLDFTGNFSTTNLNISETLNVNQVVNLESIKIDDNYITTTVSNADLEFRAAGSGIVLVPNNNVEIDQNLTTTNINTYDLTTNQNITSVELYASNNLHIRDNYIETTESNSNLELRANGTGKVFIPNQVLIDNNLSVLNNLTFIGDLGADDILGVTNVNGDQFYAEILQTDDQIRIWDNNIATVVSNANLELRANGTGAVLLEQLQFNDGTIITGNLDSSDVDLNLTADNINITSTASLQIPVGDTSERDTKLGDLRFNSDDNVFEGYNGTSFTGFGGVYSDDRLTSVTVDAFSNNIRMIVGGGYSPLDSTDLRVEITDKLVANRIDVDDIRINSNVITTTLSNSNLEFVTNCTGDLVIDDVSFENNLIKNNATSGTSLLIGNTGQGKVKFDGTYGVVVPYGETKDQPIYSGRLNITSIVSVGSTTVIEVASAHGLTTGDQVYISGVESAPDDALENLNTDDSTSPGSHGVVSAPTTTRLEIAVDTSGAVIGNYVAGTGYVLGRNSVNPPVGDTRWNTETRILETWDGDVYIASAGVFTAITQSEFDDLLLEYTLALG